MLPEYLEDLCERWALVGSRVTCNPAPTDTDQDILVLCTPEVADDMFQEEARLNGWKAEGQYGCDDFLSFKKTEDGTLLNIIMTDKPEWFDLFMKATESCKEKNLLVKADRIAEFDRVLARKHKVVPKPTMESTIASWINPTNTPYVFAGHYGLIQGFQDNDYNMSLFGTAF